MCCTMNKYTEGLFPKVINLQENILPDVYCLGFQIDNDGYICYSAMVFTLITSIIICRKTPLYLQFCNSWFHVFLSVEYCIRR